MIDGIRSLWSEVVRRAILDAQGKGPVQAYNNTRGLTKENKKAYRQSYKDMYRQNALRFIRGAGNWEMACDCLGRNPEEYTTEILEGLNGIRQTARRHAPCGRRWYKKPISSALACIAVLLIVAGCGGGGGGSSQAPPASRSEMINVLCFGTSLTAGDGDDGVYLLLHNHEADLNIDARNRGFGGHSSLDLLDHYQEAADIRAEVVLIETSMNDSYYAIPPDEVRIYITLMVREFQAHGSKVYLMTMNPELWIPTRHPDLEAYYEQYRDLAAELEVELIDLHAEWVKLEPRDLSLYIPDNVHPTMDALEIVVYPVLAEVLR